MWLAFRVLTPSLKLHTGETGREGPEPGGGASALHAQGLTHHPQHLKVGLGGTTVCCLGKPLPVSAGSNGIAGPMIWLGIRQLPRVENVLNMETIRSCFSFMCLGLVHRATKEPQQRHLTKRGIGRRNEQDKNHTVFSYLPGSFWPMQHQLKSDPREDPGNYRLVSLKQWFSKGVGEEDGKGV